MLSRRVREEEERLDALRRQAQTLQTQQPQPQSQEHSNDGSSGSCLRAQPPSISTAAPEDRPVPPLSGSLRSMKSKQENVTPRGAKRIHFDEDYGADRDHGSSASSLQHQAHDAVLRLSNLPPQGAAASDFDEIREYESVGMITPRSHQEQQAAVAAALARTTDPFDDSIQMTQSVIINTQSNRGRCGSFGSNSTGNTTPAVWMSMRKASVRHATVAERNRSMLSRKGSLGRILSKIAEENIDPDEEVESSREEGEGSEPMIDEEAVWWQVPRVDVESVTFVHPHHGDVPGTTAAPAINSIITMDVVDDATNEGKKVLRVAFDGVQQPPVTTVSLERTEHGVFLLFPEKTKGPVPDRVLAIPPEDMANVVAGVICLSERANVQQHLNYEYEALANQEAIVERYLQNNCKVPWQFVDALLPPEYLQEPASNAAVSAAIVALIATVYKERSSMCALM
eukprot:TRINITY_DN59275_c0_g1_i1.p1 TRINITY_DN59275_c0_g1~~TRINITY_DN59275_c0_g1_i1.p1  ORF type:complete len:455 (+),score=155.22 TRINITY_DN59275_c0_g1_i1:1-1365(+)